MRVLGPAFALTLAAAPAIGQWSIDSLTEARGKLVAVTIGDYVLFAGGDSPAGNYDVVDIYQVSTNSWTAATLTVARAFLSGTSVGPYVLIAGGGIDSQTPLAVVDIYDSTIGPPDDSNAWSVTSLSQARSSLAATSVGGKALFAGGATDINLPRLATVDIYDSNAGPPQDVNAWTVTALSQARASLSAESVGSVAIFASGERGALGLTDRVDIYDSLSDSWSIAQLSQSRLVGDNASTTIGSRAYFAGGQLITNTLSDVIDVYDAQTEAWSDMTLPDASGGLTGASIGNTAIFAGGYDSSLTLTDVVHMLNIGTNQWDSSAQLSEARFFMSSATIGGKVLFGGGKGHFSATASDRVDVYEPIGVNYCAANPNSTGGAATISASGSKSIAANNLSLSASPVPNQPGLFFYGAAQTQLVFGNGYLCVGAGATGIARLPVVNGTSNAMSHTLDNTSPPTALTQVLPGSTWHFSCWFRDPAGLGAAFDLSDALSVSFIP
ncbi:MAG: hypothetical protein ACI841_001522 [Planctomycetota bacterium]|jgi:hypothetical protein